MQNVAPVATPQNIVHDFARRLQKLASTDELENFSLKEMFSEVFKKRTEEEIEEHFVTGTSKATPPLEQVQTGWPKPWFFFRALAAIGVVYLGFFMLLQRYLNPKMVPGVIFMGILAFPMATLILFFEFNTPRNVSLYRVVMMVASGALVSLAFTHVGFQLANLGWMGAASAGIVEESAKFLAVAWYARLTKYKYILNGLLFGAAVGAGFEIFENAGYTFETAHRTMAVNAIEASLLNRGLTAPFCHIIWTSISAAALWRARGAAPLNLNHFFDASFLRAFLIPVGLHMIWNSPIPNPMNLKHALVGVAGWFVVFGFVQQGLKQVRREQMQQARHTLSTVRVA